MADVIRCGWETGLIGESGTVTTTGSGQVVLATATPTPRTGGYCLKCISSASYVDQQFYRIPLPSALGTVWFRAPVCFVNTGDVTGLSSNIYWRVVDGTNTAQVVFSVDASDNLIRAYRSSPSPANLLGVASAPLAPGASTWSNRVEIRVTIGSGTSGSLEVWLNDNRVMNVTGVNTQGASTSTIQALDLGVIHVANAAYISGNYAAFDDLAINDTAGSNSWTNARPGEGRIQAQLPNADNGVQQWTRGGTNTGTDSGQVGRVPFDMTSYVEAGSVGLADSYGIAAHTIPGVVQTVHLVAYGQLDTTGSGLVEGTLLSGHAGATLQTGAGVGLGTTPVVITLAKFETDPTTGAKFLQADVDNAKVGLTSA